MNIADNEYIEGLLRGIGFDCKIDGRVQTGMHFRCSSAEDYVDCLYYLAETHYSWCQPDTTPKQHHTANKETPCWTSGIRNSLHAQKILSLMDDSEFDVYVRRDNKKMNIAQPNHHNRTAFSSGNIKKSKRLYHSAVLRNNAGHSKLQSTGIQSEVLPKCGGYEICGDRIECNHKMYRE